MTKTIHPVILCGGSGTRLWPLSTPDHPKQFLSLTSDKSMIEDTAERFETAQHPGLAFTRPLVIGSKRHESLLNTKLPDARKILEPMGRNSAPAVAAACLVYDREDLVLILPADHDIQNVPAFHAAIAIAAEAAESGAIVTFGIEPTHPATGYGYIKTHGERGARGALPVEKFVEKPDVETAKGYLEAGGYFWNAGIFLFKASVMLDALEGYAPDVLSGTRNAMAGKVGDAVHLDPALFAATPSISIDYAIMERAPNVQTVPVSMGWSDVGGYRALHELLTASNGENHTSGPVHIQNSTGSYVRSEGPVITVNGVSDLVIVATPNEVMITPMNNDAAVKELGKVVQDHRAVLGVSPKLRAQARDWLWEAFDVWAEKGWDTERGGFVEQLDMDGVPDTKANRRVRVQARQVFSFAKAIEMGWPNVNRAKTLVEDGLEYIDTKLRHPDGGWVHIVNADGEHVDDKRDLYDHAFIILAGSAAYQATGSQRALEIADDAIAFIDAALKDNKHGGWFESLPHALPRRANPHMHLLEAMLAYHDATGCEKALDRAAEVVRLFETRFFQPATDILAEFFGADWRLETSESDIAFEPGHHYEWATLLSHYETLTGHDTGSWRRRLIRRADSTGLNPITGFAINVRHADGGTNDGNSRLWHQLEMLRSHFLHSQLAPRDQCQFLCQLIFNSYLDVGPKGGWLDEIDAFGIPSSSSVPASMLYHIVSAIEALSIDRLEC